MRGLTTALALAALVGAPAAAWGQNKPKTGRQVSESGLEYELRQPGSRSPRPGLILFLHGTGGNAMVWSGYASAATQRGYYAILPYSTGTGDPKAGNTSGDNLRRWADVDVPKLVSLAREIQRKYGCDPRRTFIAGYSNGGFYAFETALRNPHVFSAVLCMGAGCNVFQISEQAKNVGAYIVHGTADQSVKFEVGKQSAERLRQAGVRDVVFKEYPGRGHDIFEEEIKPFFEWLARQKRRLLPGAGVKWDTDLDAALQSGKKVLAYFYSEKDTDSDMADLIEFELLTDREVQEATAAFSCVKIDRDKSDLKITRPTLAVLDTNRKFLHKFESLTTPRQVAEKLRSLAGRK